MSFVSGAQPRFIPTLTEVVLPAAVAVPGPASAEPASVPAVALETVRSSVEIEALQDQIIHRVMQRVDLSLERRLREAVATMVLQQTQSLVPRLREEIEFVVRQSVSDAVADELATRSVA
jgi:hypothetical protein